MLIVSCCPTITGMWNSQIGASQAADRDIILVLSLLPHTNPTISYLPTLHFLWQLLVWACIHSHCYLGCLKIDVALPEHRGGVASASAAFAGACPGKQANLSRVLPMERQSVTALEPGPACHLPADSILLGFPWFPTRWFTFVSPGQGEQHGSSPSALQTGRLQFAGPVRTWTAEMYSMLGFLLGIRYPLNLFVKQRSELVISVNAGERSVVTAQADLVCV